MRRGASVLGAIAVAGAVACGSGEWRIDARPSGEAPVCVASEPRAPCGAVLGALPGWSGVGRQTHASHEVGADRPPTFGAVVARVEDALVAIPQAEREACLRRVLDEGDGALGVALLEDRLDRGREGVTALASDASPRVRAAVALARARRPGCPEHRAVVDALDDGDPLVREAALVGLRDCPQSVGADDGAIERALTDRAPSVRAEAAATLGALGSRCARADARCATAGEHAGAKVAPLVHDADEDVRVHAIYALRNLRYTGANEALRGALHGSARTRDAATSALRALGTGPSVASLRARPRERGR